jgi:hypothetical protein
MERDRSGALALPLRARRLDERTAAALRIAWRATWASRLLVWVAGVAAVLLFETSARAPGFDPAGLTAPFGEPADTLVAPGARWDGVWFLAIADEGYDREGRAAFFPLYPLLVRIGGWLVGSPLVAGILVSIACLVVALAALHELARLELGEEAARWTVIGLALSPMSFFLSAVYSEALFLAVSAGALLAARTGRWWWAGALGALAATTRSAGVVLLVPLVLMALTARPRPSWRDLAALALVPAGLATFVGALALAGQDALAPFRAQEVWFREFAGPFGGVLDGLEAAKEGARQLLSGSPYPVFFEQAGGDALAVARQNLMLFGWLLLAIPALIGAARRLPPAYAAYALAALALPLSYPVEPEPLMSLPRFELVLLPLWMWWGWWLARHPRARGPALAVSAGGLAVFTGLFATWHWVA